MPDPMPGPLPLPAWPPAPPSSATPSPFTIPPPPPPGAGGQAPRRRRWPWIAAAAVFVAVLAAVGTIVVVRGDGGRSYPDTWDPALADLVPFVERTKGATFEHPVRAVFLTGEEFDERVAPDTAGMSDDDRAAVERSEAMLRALGLHGGSGSLLDQQTTAATEGIAAFYDPDREEIVIPADDPSSLLNRLTLVHELTHALQDQLGQLDVEPGDTDEADAFKALVEGEAEHVATAWFLSLDDDEQSEAEDAEDADADMDDVSPALIAQFAFPYAVGEPMVAALDDAGGLPGAFDDPPASTADVLDPDRWLDPVAVVPVDDPELADGEKAEGEADTLGALTLYLMLASAIEPADALAATDGWGGDRMQAYADGDSTVCLRVALTGVDAAATDALADGLTAWVASRPSGAATSSRDGDVVTLDACDPGSHGAGDGGGSSALTADAASLPAVRAQLVSSWTGDGGYDLDVATCIVGEIIDRLPPELFALDELTPGQEQDATDAADAAEAACPG
ncbi:MAG: hypothetical protein QM733_16970 [Ilumatobacteraceae bacterium]